MIKVARDINNKAVAVNKLQPETGKNWQYCFYETDQMQKGKRCFLNKEKVHNLNQEIADSILSGNSIQRKAMQNVSLDHKPPSGKSCLSMTATDTIESR